MYPFKYSFFLIIYIFSRYAAEYRLIWVMLKIFDMFYVVLYDIFEMEPAHLVRSCEILACNTYSSVCERSVNYQNWFTLLSMPFLDIL